MAEQKPRKRVKDLKVHEISFVDKPAVPKARFLIVKRDDAKGGNEMDLGKDNPGDEKDVSVDLAKEAAEEVTKQQMKAMKAAREMITALMSKRGDLPPFFRRQVMEMDIAVDEFMREREAFLTRNAASITEEDDVATKRGEEETEEKAGPGGPGTGKKPKPEAAIPGFEKESEEEKALPKPKVKQEEDEEENEEKAGHKDKDKQKCPPFMVFDEESGKCVPKAKAKGEKSEKAEENEEKESAPRDGGGGDALKEAATLELSAAQKKRVDKLIEKYKK